MSSKTNIVYAIKKIKWTILIVKIIRYWRKKWNLEKYNYTQKKMLK